MISVWQSKADITVESKGLGPNTIFYLRTELAHKNELEIVGKITQL